MRFDITVGNQSSHLENDLKATMYRHLHYASQKYKWVRFLGLPVGVVSGFLTVAKRVALIFENLIKGLGNVVGSVCFKKCKFKKGLYQLILAGPAHLVALPFVVVSALVKVATKTYFISRSANSCFYKMRLNHDPIERAAYRKKISSETRAQEEKQDKAKRSREAKIQKNKKKHFCELKEAYDKDKSKLLIGELLDLARCYANGEGTVKSQNEAVNFYEEAAESGHLASIYFMACCYEKGISREINQQKSLEYLRKSVEENYAPAKVRYALYLIADVEKGKEEDLVKANQLLRECVDMGINASRCLLYGFLAYYSKFLKGDNEVRDLTYELVEKKLFDDAIELMKFIMSAREEQAKYEFKRTAAPGLAGLDDAILGKAEHDPIAWSKIPVLKIKFP